MYFSNVHLQLLVSTERWRDYSKTHLNITISWLFLESMFLPTQVISSFIPFTDKNLTCTDGNLTCKFLQTLCLYILDVSSPCHVC